MKLPAKIENYEWDFDKPKPPTPIKVFFESMMRVEGDKYEVVMEIGGTRYTVSTEAYEVFMKKGNEAMFSFIGRQQYNSSNDVDLT